MPSSSIFSSHNTAVETNSEEQRRRLPGLPGARGLDEPDDLISDEVLDALLAGAQTAEEIAGPDGVLAHLTRRLLNRALDAELTAHLGYEAGQAPPGGAGNSRICRVRHMRVHVAPENMLRRGCRTCE
jgi:hypothetical protein